MLDNERSRNPNETIVSQWSHRSWVIEIVTKIVQERFWDISLIVPNASNLWVIPALAESLKVQIDFIRSSLVKIDSKRLSNSLATYLEIMEWVHQEITKDQWAWMTYSEDQFQVIQKFIAAIFDMTEYLVSVITSPFPSQKILKDVHDSFIPVGRQYFQMKALKIVQK